MNSVCILIHSGVPNDAKLFDEIMETLQKRRIIQKGDTILFDKGYFLRCIYVLTSDYKINIARVSMGESMGGHGVPEEKIKSGYYNALDFIPDLVEICDIVHIYDNTNVPFRIFKKRKEIYFHWENKYWSYSGIEKLTGISEYSN